MGKTIDIKSQAFNKNNSEHLDFIRDEINKFKASHKELRHYDERTELLCGVMAGSWLLGYTTLFGALLTSTIYLLSSANFFGRSDYYEQEQSQLKSLYDIYCWCIKSYGKSMTSDPVFLALAEAFSGFVEMNNLKQPLKDWDGISSRFREILLQHPERELFLNDKEKATTWYNTLYSFVTSKKQDNSQDNEQVKQQHQNNVFSTMREKYLFTLYRHKTENTKGLTSTLLEEGKEKIFSLTKKII